MSIKIYFFFLLKFAQRYFTKEKIVNISSAELQLNRMRIAKHLLMYQGKMYHYRNFFDENFNNYFAPPPPHPPKKSKFEKKLLNKRYFKHDFFVFNKLLKHIWLLVKNHKKNLNIFTLLFSLNAKHTQFYYHRDHEPHSVPSFKIHRDIKDIVFQDELYNFFSYSLLLPVFVSYSLYQRSLPCMWISNSSKSKQGI